MARYRMEDGTVIDTANASKSWEERGDFDGRNTIGRCSRSQWHDQYLHRSRRGRYYIEYRSRVAGERNRAEWVSREEAARWLLLNEYEIGPELEEAAEAVSE